MYPYLNSPFERESSAMKSHIFSEIQCINDNNLCVKTRQLIPILMRIFSFAFHVPISMHLLSSLKREGNSKCVELYQHIIKNKVVVGDMGMLVLQANAFTTVYMPYTSITVFYTIQ